MLDETPARQQMPTVVIADIRKEEQTISHYAKSKENTVTSKDESRENEDSYRRERNEGINEEEFRGYYEEQLGKGDDKDIAPSRKDTVIRMSEMSKRSTIKRTDSNDEYEFAF